MLKTNMASLSSSSSLVSLSSFCSSDTKVETGLQIGIVGDDGITGLCAAIALRRAGHICEVYERTKDRDDNGTAYSITPHGGRILHRWGLDSGKSRCVIPTQTRHAQGTDSRTNASAASLRHATDGFGADWCLYDQANLRHQLYEMATSDEWSGAPTVVFTGAHVIDVHPEAGIVTFDNGNHTQKDVVIITCSHSSDLTARIAGQQYGKPLQNMCRGKAVLIGNACHIVPSTHMQSVSSNIEDAAALEVLLSSVASASSPAEPASYTLKERLTLFEGLRSPSVLASQSARSSYSAETFDWGFSYDVTEKAFEVLEASERNDLSHMLQAQLPEQAAPIHSLKPQLLQVISSKVRKQHHERGDGFIDHHEDQFTGPFISRRSSDTDSTSAFKPISLLKRRASKSTRARPDIPDRGASINSRKTTPPKIKVKTLSWQPPSSQATNAEEIEVKNHLMLAALQKHTTKQLSLWPKIADSSPKQAHNDLRRIQAQAQDQKQWHRRTMSNDSSSSTAVSSATSDEINYKFLDEPVIPTEAAETGGIGIKGLMKGLKRGFSIKRTNVRREVPPEGWI